MDIQCATCLAEMADVAQDVAALRENGQERTSPANVAARRPSVPLLQSADCSLPPTAMIFDNLQRIRFTVWIQYMLVNENLYLCVAAGLPTSL